MTPRSDYPPLLRLGFRPFFLLASIWAALAIGIWLAAFGGDALQIGFNPMPAELWHAHEMTYGFALAVVAGFLLTASAHWTGHIPAQGPVLALLAGLWALARIALYFGFTEWAALFDLGFDLGLLACVFQVLAKAKMYRNFTICALLLMVAICNARFYAIRLYGGHGNALLACEGALAVFLMLVILIAGRIIPIFAPNATPGLVIKKHERLSGACLAFSALALVAWLDSLANGAGRSETWVELASCLLCVLAAGLNFARWISYKPRAVLNNPMLWILYLAYLWIAVAFASAALCIHGLVLATMPVHAMAVGAIGMAVAGMICRVARGHTGRIMKAAYWETLFFLLILFAAILRVIASMPQAMASDAEMALIMSSGSCWMAGFAIYALRYAPWLASERADGRPG